MILWLASYPKSGNTWMRAIITSLFYTKDGIFNFDLLSYIPNFEKLETFEFIKDLNLKDYNNLSDLNVLSKYWIKAIGIVRVLSNWLRSYIYKNNFIGLFRKSGRFPLKLKRA